MRVALLGAGNIAAQYLASLPKLPNLVLVAIADMDEARAAQVAAEQRVRAVHPDELAGADDVEAVINITPPAAHAPTTTALLNAGKHVYQEKPFALTLAEAEAMTSLAAERGLRLGTAPDTVLGTGIQTSRALIDEGAIGTPVGAAAHMLCPGHEGWHPNPGFYYAAGGGPLLDMGVYYLTALVTLLGPIQTVSGFGSRLRGERLVPEGAPRAGERLPVEVDTHVAGVLHHASGAISTLTMSFDVAASALPPIELWGIDGTIAVPDPNRFSDPVRLGRRRNEWEDVPARAGYRDAGRGYGLAEMAVALDENRPHRQSAELALHVHNVMTAIADAAAADGAAQTIVHTCERPAAVPLSDIPGGEEPR